jgi:hypothetical protein
VLEYLKHICRVKNPLSLHTNARRSHTDKKGNLGATSFWLDKTGIANVISLKTLENKFHVKYDSKEKGGAFICKTPKGEIVFQ